MNELLAEQKAVPGGTDGSRLAWRRVAFPALAILGLGVSVYLTAAHYEQFALACPANSVIDCTSVTHSVYAQFFGTEVPVSAAGLAWFAIAFIIGALQLRAHPAATEASRLWLASGLWSAVGMVYVLYLVYVELVRVHRICEWCTVVHVTVFAMLLVSLIEFQHAEAEQELDFAE